jgi:putative transposase
VSCGPARRAEHASPARQCWEREEKISESGRTAHYCRHSRNGNAPSTLDMMPHAYVANCVHIVFATHERRDSIPSDVQAKLWTYIAGIGRNHEMKIYVVGGTANHIHVLADIPAKLPVAKAVQTIKANSSRWMSERRSSFRWQEGYGAFAVSASLFDATEQYIRNQAEHHKRRGFDEEFVALLKKYRIAHDPAALFD